MRSSGTQGVPRRKTPAFRYWLIRGTAALAIFTVLVLAAYFIVSNTFLSADKSATEDSRSAKQQIPTTLSSVSAIPDLGPDKPLPTPEQVSSTLSQAFQGFSGKSSAQVTDVLTGQELYNQDAGNQMIPGSNLKIFVAASAVKNIDPQQRFTTKVLLVPGQKTLILRAGGDVLLGAGESNPGQVNGRAGLATLAAQTAQALAAQSATQTQAAEQTQSATASPSETESTPSEPPKYRVVLDDSLFSGDNLNPLWDSKDVSNGEMAPIYPLALRSARGADGSSSSRPRDAALDAAQAFVQELSKQGASVTDQASRDNQALADAGNNAEGESKELAAVQSATAVEQINYMLSSSDNYLAEVLARLAAQSAGRGGSLEDATAVTASTVKSLGVDTTGMLITDSSGLALSNRVSAKQIAEMIRILSTTEDARLSYILPGFPTAGMDGTLTNRFKESQAAPGVGVVHAKTGSLNTASALSGYLVTAEGRLLAFSFITNELPQGPKTAEPFLDRAASSLAACGCR